jgi:hypothetical protein
MLCNDVAPHAGILSEAAVILSEAKDLPPSSCRVFRFPFSELGVFRSPL